MAPGRGDVWFFAYGSLLWKTGFDVSVKRRARLYGWHRSFCVSSKTYRGTPERPGLSLGLDLGGSCNGYAFKIMAANRAGVFSKLTEREMPEEIYSCRQVKLYTLEGELTAITLTVNRDHYLYCSNMTVDEIAKRIASCHGKMGSNRDYLENTARYLEDCGICDHLLNTLLDRVRLLG